MATTRRQSQFRRLLSLGLFVPLILAVLAGAQPAQTAELVAPPSNYRPLSGQEFFLLAEKSFGSDEQAAVRLEIQGNANELEEYGGVDIAVYRIPDPIAFLRAQSNLHRIKVPAKPQQEGMGNMLTLSWDKVWANTRFAWKRLFAPAARHATTETAPELKTPHEVFEPTRLHHAAAYAPLPGFTLTDRFRYPVHRAKPIAPPAGTKLEGSSSEFIPRSEGNVLVPLGKRAPGLYLVEASVGKHRALTVIFVSDSVAVSKNTSNEMLVWTAQRKTGAPIAEAEVAWSDGVGVVKSGRTDAEGIARLSAASPETSYVFGVDPAGGVFISENFYHDSEIYNAKLYAITDRPLYRPGDLVQVKFLGREFKSARRSVPVPSGNIDVTVIDPAGTEIISRTLKYDAAKGGEMDFRLPKEAQAGGWELVFAKGGDRYGAAFRVADYVKPHFEVDVVLDKSEFKTKENVTGRVKLTYPDGKPVADALVRLTARAQALSMVEGELRYGGQFPLAIKADELKTNRDGVATFNLPAAEDPSRYILSLLAQDGAAYRVRANKEILIERGATLWQLAAPANFSKPGEAVDFRFTPQSAGTPASRPTRWEAIRLEDRQRRDGTIADKGDTTRISFPEAGSYTVSLRDAKGNLLAATSHWVSGEGMKATPGSVEIVFDKERYQAGETAHALVTFPVPVDNALLTLERDQVEAHALLGGKGGWLTQSRLSPAQWRVDIPVKDDYGPNITFSVLYLNNGDYVFQNKGLRVAVPAVEVAIRPAKERYAPGETVNLEVETKIGGRPVPAQVTLGVVDEMIYVLQPEIAPTIGNFFYHPRRNNVRTAVSLSFIGYDLARLPGKGSAPVRRSPSERGIKLLERPRRDDTDTAGWWPGLTTGKDGKASVSFRMPDALTRWRITARAMTADGVVGQQTRYVESHKDFYAKWTGPATFRLGDQPSATIVAFNQTGAEAKAQLSVTGGGLAVRREVTLQPGANNIPLTLEKPTSGDVEISLGQGGREIDSLRQPIAVLPPGWLSERALTVDLKDGDTRLPLPPDARDVKISLAQGAGAQFARIANDLLEYPWGCVEQTSSRLLPLSLAYRSLPADSPRLKEISQAIATHRLRLIQMAGPEAVFGWWGPSTDDSAWLTAYAYYTDWHASRALGLKLPDEHWRQALQAYTKHADTEPLPLRTLAVWFMSETKVPVGNLVQGLVKDAGQLKADKTAAPRGSLWLGSDAAGAQTLVLIGQLARQHQITISPELAQRIDAARDTLRAQPDALGQALLAMEAKGGQRDAVKEDAARWLATLGPTAPTFDRALALAWWNKALGGSGPEAVKIAAAPKGNWQAVGGSLGAPTWRWTGKDTPATLALAAPPAGPLTAIVRYRSAEPEKGKLPVQLERHLYRLVAQPAPARTTANDERGQGNVALVGEATQFKPEPVGDGDIRSNELYMEEIVLTVKDNNNAQYGLIEVPLPPGADVEKGTWGIMLPAQGGEPAPTPMERARSQSGELSYAIPVDHLTGSQTFRHLLRFGSRGSFVLPPARYHRMYQPEEKAFEAGSERRLKVK